ncbi:Holliday junction resolvase RuvX [Oceanicoccus sp. KOV_DT_Chl]|uniref:Holliday junction resolvase RuvX n=1 Tax=Oceanicoccus sp. KOV_DT_Chl TaxID=1904639 RepID=UPI000C7D320E|nr:Holliday junction resolvase RuvX [Oceanicoccus sp. KOV_DT_Chl]
MSDNKRPLLDAKSILCFDYGTKSIGVAIGQSITQTANPLIDLKAQDGIPSWEEIKKILDEWRPDLLLIGLPLNMDGSESELSTRAKKFANRLHGRFGLPIAMADERLSSFAAKGEIIQQTGSRDFKKNNVDSLAAKIILESWFTEHGQ